MKLYRTWDYETRKYYWWTQRDRNGNCYEIRQLEFSKKLRLYVNEVASELFDTLTEAEKRINELWAA